MGRQVALLRGINVGGHRRVPMDALREVAASVGFTDIATYIQSGNLVYGSALAPGAAAARLEAALAKRFGFAVDVVARSAADWGRYAAGGPFPAARAKEPDKVLLLITKEAPKPGSAEALAAKAAAGEKVEAAAGGVWVHFPGGAGRSRLPAHFDRCLEPVS